MATKLYPIYGRKSYFTPQNFTLDEIQNIYLGYFDNLITYIKAYEAEVMFVNNAELISRDPAIQLYMPPTRLNDRFIESGMHLEKLGRDLETKGTYWSFICYKDKRIKEGDHRFRGLRCINSNRKVMAVFINDTDPGLCTQRVINKHYTMTMLFPEKYIREFFLDTHNFTEFKKVGKSLYRVTSNHLSELDQVLIRYSMFTSWLLFYYHGQIKPVDFVNDEEAFNKWKLKNNL